jgi:RHS repeat-associated protein
VATRYYFQDHLGTSKTITTSAGVVCYDADFLPFGYEMAYVTSCPQNYKFTGLERDSETGLDHTLFRKYDSRLGRWLTPDKHRGNPFNPQSWNRYVYVLNNPGSFTDPLGLEVYAAANNGAAGGDDGGGGGDDDDDDDDDGGSDLPCYDGNGQPIDCSQLGPAGIAITVYGTPDQISDEDDEQDSVVQDPSSDQQLTQNQSRAQAATQYCRQHGQLSFNVPFTNTPVTISASATLGPANYSSTNDLNAVFPLIPWPEWLAGGASFDITINAPSQPSSNPTVGFGKNLSLGYFTSPSGPQGISISLGPSVGPPINVSVPTENACGMRAGGR